MQRNLDITPNPRAGSQQAASRRQPMTKQRKRLFIVAACVVTLVIIGLGWWGYRYHSPQAFIRSNEYQAVFLTNNQVYFGKLQQIDKSHVRLTNVYYLRQDANTNGTGQNATTAADQGTPKLVKLGDELHGPEDEIIFGENQVLFWENLKPDGKVSKAIADSQKK